MFCPKCGSQIPDNAAACPNCGEKMEAKAENVTAQSEVVGNVQGEINNDDNKKNNVIVKIAAAVVAVVVVILLISSLFGSSYKDPVKKLVKLCNKKEESSIEYNYINQPKFLADYTKTYEEILAKSDYDDDYKNTYEYVFDDWEDTYGEEKDNKIYQDNGTYDYESQEKKPWTNKWLKLAMIIAIVVIGFPIVIPLGAGILALIVGIVIAVFCLFAAIVIGFAAVVMVGVVLFAAGIGSLFANPGVGLAGLGAGLMVIASGVIGTVVGVRLCFIVFPGIVRGIVYILRKPFHRKSVA